VVRVWHITNICSIAQYRTRKEVGMIAIDIPQVAYKTMCIEYRIYDDNGNRCFFEEQEAERDLQHALSDYRYSADHDHVR